LEEFFETKQNLNASYLAKEFGLTYSLVKSLDELESAMSNFYAPGIQPKILEIESVSTNNAAILKQIKAFVSDELNKSKE
jgi:2-succinyl-5-enolpyruvyl-6-hydroxy-3-cyclohexene-1-carboxylate synthase